ncbi:MAG: phosphopantothenoylcysteine decarboxylase [bacterium]
MSKIKKTNQLIIGFCAETDNLINNAKKKLQEKNLDFIAANDISNKEIGFNSDYNSVILINKAGETVEISKTTKKELAGILLNKIAEVVIPPNLCQRL